MGWCKGKSWGQVRVRPSKDRDGPTCSMAQPELNWPSDLLDSSCVDAGLRSGWSGHLRASALEISASALIWAGHWCANCTSYSCLESAPGLCETAQWVRCSWVQVRSRRASFLKARLRVVSVLQAEERRRLTFHFLRGSLRNWFSLDGLALLSPASWCPLHSQSKALCSWDG